jgi:uncharacterized protein YecE (DUF72 family)
MTSNDRAPPVNLRVGLCGFTVSMKTYALHFPVVEVQNTFYDPPPDATLKKWRTATPASLEYTIKVWQLVTHAANSPTYRRLKSGLTAGQEPGFFRDSPTVEQGWQRSLHCASVLSATAMLFQCPASFTPDAENIKRMRSFFERIERPSARLLWEPRGPKWTAKRELALALCRDLRLVHVVDPFVVQPEPGLPVYWRLHGIGGARHSYTDEQLRALHRMLLQAAPREPAYVMFNNLSRMADARRFKLLITASRA